MPEFLNALGTSFDVIGRMALLVILGFVLVRKRILGEHTLGDITRFLIDIVIPSAFILAMTRSFSFALLEQGGILALLSAGWIILSWGFGTAFYRVFPGPSQGRDRSVTAMMMISNSLYLPLPVILAVAPAELQDTAVVYISVISLPSILFMWTAGVRLLSGPVELTAAQRMKKVFNPPIVSFFLGIILSTVPGVRESARCEAGGLPVLSTVFSAMDHLGRMLSPMAMLVLGGMIASAGGAGRVPMRYLLPLAAVRLVLVPGAALLLLLSGAVDLLPLAGTVLILVAAAPPATNHALIARRYHGEWQLVSSLQLITHLIALVTLPVWLSIAISLM